MPKNNCLASCRHNKEGTRVNAQFRQQSLRYLLLLTSTRPIPTKAGGTRPSAARLDPRTSETRCKQGARDHAQARVAEKQASKQADAAARQGKTNWKGTSFQQRFYIDDCKPTRRWRVLIIPARCRCKPGVISSSVKKKKNYDERKQGEKMERGTVSSLEICISKEKLELF